MRRRLKGRVTLFGEFFFTVSTPGDFYRGGQGDTSVPFLARDAPSFPQEPSNLRSEMLGLVEEWDVAATVEDEELLLPIPLVEGAVILFLQGIRFRVKMLGYPETSRSRSI
jgi:hypothetical protein